MNRALGINGRNGIIARKNPRGRIVDAKDKILTKQRLAEASIPTPETLRIVQHRRDARRFDDSHLPDSWVVKPSRGSGGRGILVVVGRDHAAGRWQTPSRTMTTSAVRNHLVELVGGDHSIGDDDIALFEPLLRPHPAIAALTVVGLPDIRVVCEGTTPLLAMARIPTMASGGRGNLHQGGIGAAIDLASGRIVRAVHAGAAIDLHPDTRRSIVGTVVPAWSEVLDIAMRCSEATGLGYLGVDLVVDAERGPLVLEVNSHPGLEIQNVTASPLLPSRRRRPVALQSSNYDVPVPVR